MATPQFERALIVGAGQGLSAALARLFTRYGMQVALAARDTAKLQTLCAETHAQAFKCDATVHEDVTRLFDDVHGAIGDPHVVVYNASSRVRGPLIDLDPRAVERAIAVTAFGGFLVAQEAVRRMLPNRNGAILFTGASASIKGYAQSATFAMGKFALRGLAQSMARELSPQGIHVAHFVIDGGIAPARAHASEFGGGCAARPRCDRGELSSHPAPAAQRVDIRSRAAAVGREVLKSIASTRPHAARRGASAPRSAGASAGACAPCPPPRSSARMPSRRRSAVPRRIRGNTDAHSAHRR